jgi:hypothetical protein
MDFLHERMLDIPELQDAPRVYLIVLVFLQVTQVSCHAVSDLSEAVLAL